MKKCVVFTVALLMTIASVAQSDSLLQLVQNTSAADSLRMEAAFQLAEDYIRHQNDEEQFVSYSRLALTMARKIDSERHRGKALRFIGSHKYRTADYDSSLIYLTEAEQIFKTIQDSSMLAQLYVSFSGYYERVGNLSDATRMTIAACTIFEALKDFSRLCVTYSNLALVFSKQEDFESCLKYRRLAYQYSSGSAPYYQSYFASQLGSTYGELWLLDTTKTAYTDSLLKYVAEGLAIAQEHNLPDAELTALGKILSYHITVTKNYDLALLHAKNLLSKAKKYQYPKYICEGYFKRADLLIGMGQLDQAAVFADSALLAAEEADWDYYKMVAYERIYEINKKAGHFDKALAAYEQFKTMEDSLVNVEKTEAINDLEKKYQTEKKEHEIVTLQRETELKNAELRQRNLVIVAVVLLLIMVALGGYFFYRQRSLAQQQKLSLAQHRLLRAQMNPHFFFNALSSIQTFFLQEQDGKKAVLYLSKFAKLMRLVLENSTTEFIPIKEEISTLEGYLDLQKIRFQDGFSYTIHCDEAIDIHTMSIPPMFAQPFIENALEHGLLPKEGQGKIHIAFHLKGDTITFTVEDNGVGIEKSAEIRRSKAKEHKSRATAITRDRLFLLSHDLGRTIDLRIEDVLDATGRLSGTRVTIDLPYQRQV